METWVCSVKDRDKRQTWEEQETAHPPGNDQSIGPGKTSTRRPHLALDVLMEGVSQITHVPCQLLPNGEAISSEAPSLNQVSFPTSAGSPL